jgi:PPOX class probable F420-dependent enzyme
MRLPDDAVAGLLERWPVARLAITRAGRAPLLLPVVFVSAAGALWSPIDGKPKSGAALARLAALRAAPRVSLLLDHYDAAWRRLWWLRVEGDASLESARPESLPALPGVEAALRRKYPQYAGTPLFAGDPTLLRIVPLRTASWCAGEEALAAVWAGIGRNTP